MATTTIQVYAEERDRLAYYKTVFSCGSIADILKVVMDKAGLASVEDIKRLRKLQGVGEH